MVKTISILTLVCSLQALAGAVPDENGFYRTDPATNAFEYLLVAPPDFYDDWRWYVDQRKKAHPDIRFAVKNTAAIYAEHPFSPSNDCRNAAESIHAYLRQVYQDPAVSNRLQYVVLGGAWLDAQNRLGYTPYFATGEAMSLSNCVPGIYGYPRETWREIPSDLFYGCFDLKAGQKYPWDANGDGKYVDQSDCQYNDTYPEVSVSRITLNPFTGISGKVYNPHALITNYVAKLKRGEAKDFAGHYRYGMSAASTGSSKQRKTGDRMYYRELEFYDGMRNMFDPRHHDTLEDDEYSTRVRYYEQYSMWRPIRSVKGMMSYTWTGGQPTLAAAMDDYYAADRDFGYVQAHGWAQGAAQFSAYRFATAKGLTLFNGGSGPCETGYPDYHVWSGGKKVLQYNVGDAAVTNPDGGALASVNNSRWSWAGGGGGFAAMSYYMLNEMLVGFNGEGLDVGHAWLKGVRNYWPAGRWGNTAGWVLTEQFLYGDPLVRLPDVPNVWWTGGETGVWDRVTAHWTNSVDDATAFDAANNVYFDIGTNLTLDVAGEIAAMRLSLPVHEEDAVITLAGTGTLRVMQAVDVAGTNTTLRFDVAGGVGHNGIRFLTGAGDLVFAGTNKFYAGGVANASRVALLGGGVTLDADEFAPGSFPLLIDGSREPILPLPNELRSKNVGGLRRFGSLAITNSHVKLSTVDAFGNGAPMLHALTDSTLEIAANVYYQRSGFPEGLNATFRVDGASEVTSSEGGLWTVKHETAFALGAGTHLTLSADTVHAGGRIVITNRVADATCTNTVEIAHASALAGDVVIGKGIRLVLRELPLSGVTSLTVGEGATIQLPDDASGYWQIVPVSSKFNCADDVAFVTASRPTEDLDGSPSPTGSFFREGALYRWTGQEGEWNTFFANRHPKILFGDLAGIDVVTVRVASAVSPEFAFFSNLKTKYVFEPVAEDASVRFSSVYFCGPTAFNVPVRATEYADVSTSTSRFADVAAPYVHIAAGAGLALAGSHWTDFRFDADARMVAVPGEVLDWNTDTTLTFPDDGEVLLDVGALALSDRPTPLIGGRGHVWVLDDLKRFRLEQSDAELRLVDNTLCVVGGEGLKGPYALSFSGATNWNCAAWTWAGSNAFPRVWGACALDWTADARICTTNVHAAATLTVDCDVHVSTLYVNASTQDFTLRASDGFSTIHADTLDLSECHGTTVIGVDLGAAEILTGSSTNGTDIVHLTGRGSGTIDLEGITLILDHLGDWSLTLGAQGVLKVVAPQAYERFRVAKVPDGFKDSALTVKVLDAEGREIDGFKTSISDGALWCEPPALQAEVPPGTNDLTRLVWRDVLGNAVSSVDWATAAGFQLIGTPTSGVVIAKNGFSAVWSRLSVSNDVTLYGDETIELTQIPTGSGLLKLAGAFTVNANLQKHRSLLNGSHLDLGTGVVMNLSHGGGNLDVSDQNWKGIVGTGKIVFTDSTSSWIAIPGNLFASTLSVASASDIVLTQNITDTNPFAVRNLSGGGSFRTDWGNGNWRPVMTLQTGVSEFSGVLAAKAGSRDSCLIVSSDAATATTNKALVLSGNAVAAHHLDIKKTGCVILTGSWKGTINVSGILVITNACATNGLSVTVAAGGEVKLVAPDALPALTAAPEYVAPTYPDDPVTPDEPVAVDECVRILTSELTAVGGASALSWAQLDWRDTNGAVVASVDWSAVTNVTITATDGSGRLLFDAEAFTGVVHLAGALLEVRKTCPFLLAADSAGTIDFRLHPEPTATCDLISTLHALPSNVTVTVHNRYGLDLDVAGEVAFNASTGRYYLNVQNVNAPTYSCTFDAGYEDSITSPLWFNGSGNLTYKARPDLFVESRAGRALLGSSMNGYAMHSHNGNPTVYMDDKNVWSFNFVVKLPTNDGGIIFGWGNKDSGNGVAFARVRENVAGVYAWENGGGVRLVASANVALASAQFHAYAITFDGQTLSFYVDGVLAQTASLVGKYPSRGFYQWFKMYGQNGGLANGPTTVIDDFRLYVNTCLTPTSVRKIAADFPPWPDRPTAEVDVTDLAWSNLYWSAELPDDDTPVLVTAGAGTLRFDAPVTVSNALVVSGGVVPVSFVGDGAFVVPGGLTVSSALALDCSKLDGTNLASFAVANVPYSRWLIRGAYSGTIDVTALPSVPEDYAVRVERDTRYGVRLVFTAPRYAFAKAVGLSVGNDAFDGLSGTIGLHPTSPTNWFAYATWTNEATVIEGLAVTGSAGGKVDTQSPYGAAAVARYFAHTSFDGDSDAYNGMSNGLTVSGLAERLGRYRVLVYLATDTDGAHFGPVTIAGRTYCGPQSGSESEGVTLVDSTAVSWGKSKVVEATEGVNVVISDVLEADEVCVSAQRLKNGSVYARAQIAALEFVKVGEIHAFTGSRYSADVEGDGAWMDGAGANLTHHGDWKNGAFSSICLTAKVNQATLTFDTAVTAETFRVVTTADQALTFSRGGSMAFYEIDLSASEGAVTLRDDIHLCGAEGSECVLAANPKGMLDIVIDNVSTNRRLMRLAADFDCTVKDFVATVHDREGRLPDESWTVLPVDGWLVLQRLDVDAPRESLTFEDALTTHLDGTIAVSLKEEGTASYVDAGNGRKALTGATPYSNDPMASVPASWTIHAVARMPKESNGLLFGYGRQGQRGVGLVTVDANDVAVAWWDSRGKFTVINAAVTNATCQFHAYALVSTGTRVLLYVDGVLKGSADVAVNPQTPVMQVGSVYGGSVSGFTKTTTGALDEWRLYDGVLSTNAIRTLADRFVPWPDYRTAALTEENTDWDALVWEGVDVADRPRLVDSQGGSLAVTNVCTLTNALYATGRALALRFAGEGVVVSEAGLMLLAGWTIDCSGLEATNLTARADQTSPYVHWLFRGAYSGDDPMLTGVPELPSRYSLVTVADPATGVRLVVTVRADYVADLTNTTAWTDGAGAGLDVKSVSWANDATSTITLTQRVDAATLTFDTAVTSACFKVVSTNGQSLILCCDTAAVNIARYDFSQAFGTVALSNDVPSGTRVDLGPVTVFGGAMNGTFGTAPAGARVRYAQRGLVIAGGRLAAAVSNTFASAVVNDNVYNNARTYLVRDGDDLTIRPSAGSYDNYRLAGTVVIEGGRLLIDSQSQKDRLWYGVCGASSFTQTGGETIANVKSDTTKGSTCFTIGNTGSGNIPFVITGGTFAVPDAPVCFWQHESLSLTVGGTGVVRVKGLYGNGTKGRVTVNAGGTLSVGTAGIAANLKALTLNGGLLTAHADATTAMTLALEADSTIAADAGVTHTVTGTLSGSGTLTIGTATRTGTVRFPDAAALEHDLVLAFGTLDLGTNRPTRTITRTGGKIQLRLTPDEEGRLAKVPLIPVGAGMTSADFVVLGSGGGRIEAAWLSIADGRLVVDTQGMDFSTYEMPLRGTFAAGRAWADQAWYESSASSNRVPAVYWDHASNVIAVLDIATNAVVTGIPGAVTNLTVTGEGTIVSDGEWPNFGGLTNAAWRGTLRIANKTDCTGLSGGCTFDGLGSENSTVEMDNVAGWFDGYDSLGTANLGKEHPYALKIGAGGFTMNNGNSGQGYAFKRLTGCGAFTVGKGTRANGPTFRVVAREAASFVGTIGIIGKAGVTLGTPTANAGDGTIVVAKGASASIDPAQPWSAVSGVSVEAGATLDVRADGTAESYAVVSGTLALAEGAALTFAGGGNVRSGWTVDGGTLVKVDEWSANKAVDTEYARPVIRLAAPMTLALTGAGRLVVSSKLDASAAKLTIDASGIDGTNIAQYAVAGAPYSHWIVKGTVVGDVAVTALPPMPVRYSVRAEVIATHGVRLVVTANRAARFGAISLNFAGGRDNVWNSALSRLSDNDQAAKEHGAYPVVGAAWSDLSCQAGTYTASNATVTVSGVKNPYTTNRSASPRLLYGYADDGSSPLVTVTGIPYARYRVIVYRSTDSENWVYSAVKIGTTANDAAYYYGPTAGEATGGATLSGAAPVGWGDSDVNEVREGVTYVVSDVLTAGTPGSGTAYIYSQKHGSNTRAGLAAIQIVKVGDVYEGESEYDVVKLASKLSYVLPGTTVTQAFDYVYHPLGDDNHTWDTPSNWATVEIWQRKDGTHETNYTSYAGAKSPYVSGTYVPVAIVGCSVTSDSLDGWNERVGLFEGATLTVKSQKKFQSDDNTRMFVAVDETSRYAIESWGSESYNRSVDFYIAAPSGLLVKAAYSGKSTAFDYHLVGEGSVCFEKDFSGTHRLQSATIELGDARWTDRKKAKKYLILGSGTVTATGDVVAGGVRKANDAELADDDAVGTYRIAKDDVGTFVEWMARAQPEILEVHPADTDEIIPMNATNAVKIVCRVTNDTVETRLDLTAAFHLVTTNGGVHAALNPKGRVRVLMTGAAVAEEIPVQPELATVENDDHVSSVPFALTDSGAAVGVKAIPGLVYRLMRGDTPAAACSDAAHEAARSRAGDTRLKLTDPNRPAGAAFYLIRVTP